MKLFRGDKGMKFFRINGNSFTHRKCCNCHKVKSLTDYFRDRSLTGGREYICKLCSSKKKRNLEKRCVVSRRYAKKNPEKVIATSMVNGAVKSGVLIKPKRCPQCGKKGRIHGHHNDYSEPLEVKWLCPLCHTRIHREKEVAVVNPR